ncbi:hypothetical protein CH371_06605 [Leptospira wolffii]|uniref:MAPEG family protein n=1 Tax=Leptospira wolffii TaxID=409998 RepID=A0A2M9ZGV6_9LEPT|nr:MAPEG family protein [Leptospira wolffii]PJZ67668.1 hypothetical protein CH371_06605 [Leptospira wolffii]
MQKELWLFPIGAMALLTFLVVLQIPIRRFYAGFYGKVTADDFKFGESKRVPPWVSIANRNYMNLLEIPMLFYLICILHFITGKGEPTELVWAWVYVILRFAHSTIHLTYNNVYHRLAAFAFSNFVLAGIWAYFFLELIS